MLEVTNLHAKVGSRELLRGINLSVQAGEVHAIMGPNGSGKSTLAAVLAGSEEYDVTDGSVLFSGHNLLDMEPEERAREGLFLAFQYPVEVPGVTNLEFLKAAVEARSRHYGEEPLNASEFLKQARAICDAVNLDQSMAGKAIAVKPLE